MNIDREIAEKVMGWFPTSVDEKGPLYELGSLMHLGFYPSTNIQHAMEVVEKMNSDGYAFEVTLSHSDLMPSSVRLVELTGTGVDEIFLATVKNNKLVPEAICLAALSAIK